MKKPAGPPIAHSYEGRVLIATPSLRDGVFTRAVVYMCAHRGDGAMGIVVNQRAADVRFSKLLVQLDIVKESDAIRLPPRVEEIRVLRGGPVDTGRGFMLHSSDYSSTDSTVQIDDSVCLTATLDILRAIATGSGPKKAVLALGCAGWAAGQLESEILANAWLVGPADPALLFGDDFSGKYDHALGLLGARAAHLSADAGHA
jgi:putative transcriptional regulator